MTPEEILRLKYRRQYILSPQPFECPFLFHQYNLRNGYKLYAQIDLNVTEFLQDDLQVFLLGDIFDYETPLKNNYDILKDLSDNDFSKTLEKSARYAGRFVLIGLIKDHLFMFHDATATRKVFYYSSEQGYWCASQPYLLANILKLKKTKNESKLRFYNSPEFELLANSNIGNMTVFDDISQLLPNYYLDITNNKTVRYWPNHQIENLSLEVASEEIAKRLKGFVESIGNRYKIMLPVTAGKDSRTLFAATRDISEHVYYYINKENNMPANSIDIMIPNKLINKLGHKFNVVDPYIEIDKDFEKLYFENNENALPKYLPIIYNYYVNHSDKINMPGVFAASAYEIYGSYDDDITPVKLAVKNSVNKYEFAVEYYSRWLKEATDVCRKNNLNILALFYWEERLANWGTQIQIFKDMAQDDFVPFNSRQLIEYCFSVQPKFNNKPDYILYKKIMNELWPETLSMPINPNFKHLIFSILEKFGIFEPLRKLKFKLSLISI